MISIKNVIRKLQVSNFGGVLVTLKSSNLLTVAWIKLIFLKIAPFFLHKSSLFNNSKRTEHFLWELLDPWTGN